MRTDCNITENFLWEKNRMTRECVIDCENCALYSTYGENTACMVDHKGHAKEAIAIVQKWSDVHPRKTILNDLLEKYPKVMLNKNGIPDICPYALGYENLGDCNGDTSICVACWNQEMEGRNE